MQEFCLLWIVTCIVFIDFLLYSLLLPFVGRLVIEGEVGSYFQAGVLFGITAVSGTLCMPFWHYLSVKSAKFSAILGLVITAAACWLFGWYIHNYWLNLAARFLQGLGCAGATVGSGCLLSDQYKRHTMITGGIVFAALIGPPLGGFLFEMNPAYPFYFLAILCAPLAISLIAIQEDRNTSEETVSLTSGTTSQKSRSDFCSVLKSREGSIWSRHTLNKKSNATVSKVFSMPSLAVLIPIVLCNAAVVFVEWSLCARHAEWAPHIAGLYLTWFFLGYIITAQFVIDYFEDEFITIAGGLIGCSAILLITIESDVWWYFIILLVCLGTCTALVEANISKALQYVGYDKSAVLELTELSVRLGCIFSGILGGLMVHLLSFNVTYHTFAILVAIGAPVVFSITFWVEPPPEEIKPTQIQLQIQEKRDRDKKVEIIQESEEDDDDELTDVTITAGESMDVDGGLFSI